jgi:hypothetical protein
MNHYDQQLARDNDGPNRYGWFTELKNGWIFNGELLNNQMVMNKSLEFVYPLVFNGFYIQKANWKTSI